MSEERIVGSVDVGRSKILSDKHTLVFNFHDFESLSDNRGEKVLSPSLPCHGHYWSLEINPGGDTKSNQQCKNVSAFLRKGATEGDTSDLIVKYSMRIDSAGVNLSGKRTFTTTNSAWGWHDFVRRADVLDRTHRYLLDGTLSIKVDIQVYSNKPVIWTPNDTLSHDMLQMYKSPKYADVIFAVGETEFHAHRNVLAIRAPSLAALSEDVLPNTVIQIDNVDPSDFQALLHFLYSDELPSGLAEKEAKSLLQVADLFGCSRLKLLAEAELSASGITVENAAELLLFADSKNCAQLKESATNFFLANRIPIMASDGYSKLEESPKLLAELMRALILPIEFDNGNTENVDLMGIGTLREKLDAMGLDVDGTRKMLVERLSNF